MVSAEKNVAASAAGDVDQLRQQLTRLENALRAPLALGHVWVVVPVAWVAAYRAHLESGGRTPVPPPIDSAALEDPARSLLLKDSAARPLRRDLAENADYVFLPQDLVRYLHTAYGAASPAIERRVIATGAITTNGSRGLEIELHPLLVCVHDEQGRLARLMYASRRASVAATVGVTAASAGKSVGVEGGELQERRWVAVTPEDAAAAAAVIAPAVDADTSSSARSYAGVTRRGRRLTSDVADIVHVGGLHWRLLRDSSRDLLLIEDLLVVAARGITEGVVDVLLEEAVYGRGGEGYPLDDALYAWQRLLRPGDELDCAAPSGQWFDAVVVAVDSSGGGAASGSAGESPEWRVTVHLRGWEPSKDMELRVRRFNKLLQPLHSQEQTDWRLRLREGCFVDLKIDVPNNGGVNTEGGVSVITGAGEEAEAKSSAPLTIATTSSTSWVRGKVRRVDYAAGTAEVEYYRSGGGGGGGGMLGVKIERLDSERLCRGHTHTTAVTAEAASSSEDGVLAKRQQQQQGSSSSGGIGSSNKNNSSTSLGVGVSGVSGSESLVSKQQRSGSGTVTAGKSMAGFGSGGGGNRRSAGGSKGATGLANLGNTCFMNSMLQCLSNSEPLTRRFLATDSNGRSSFESELNEDNPLGHGGRIARSYARLLTDMWSGEYSVVAPTHFKGVIGEFAPQFSGYQQQDSQELMSCVLDGLHEDLNRVHRKPYVPSVDSDGRPDAVVSREAWSGHVKRNDSLVNDVCFGQMRSHLTCSCCGAASVTFDPFSSLSLPVVPSPVLLALRVLVTLPDHSQTLVGVTIDAGRTVVDLKTALLAAVAMHNRSNVTSSANVHVCVLQRVGAVFGKVSKTLPARQTLKDLFKTQQQYGGGSSRELVVAYVLSAGREAAAEEPTTSYGGVELAEGTLDLHFAARVATPTTSSILYTNLTSSVTLGGGSFAYSSTPRRVFIKPGATRRQLYRTVAAVIHSALGKQQPTAAAEPEKEEEEEEVNEEQLPFELFFANQYGTSLPKELVPLDDEVFAADGREALLCLWRERKKNDGENALNNNTDNNDSNDDNEDGEKVWPPRLDSLSGFEDQFVSTPDAANPGGSSGSGSGITLSACLDKFSESEQLAAEDTVYCGKCKQHQAPVKKLDIWAAPDMLIVHLKRFQYSKGAYFVQREKITELVRFPITDLDLTPYVKGPASPDAPPVYDLYAVSEHSGGLGGGHYTAKCRNFLDGCWYDFNDSSVTPTTAERSVTPQAYVLFYKRQRGSLRWGGLEITPSCDDVAAKDSPGTSSSSTGEDTDCSNSSTSSGGKRKQVQEEQEMDISS